MRATPPYLAHSRNLTGEPEPLRVHLARVAERAAEFGQPFGASIEARIAGLLHDVGKYGDLFQRRLEGKEHGIDHWSAGAWEALDRYHMNGIAAALAIQGHHIGLQAASPDHLRELEPQRCALRIRPRRLSGPHDEVVARMSVDGLPLPKAGDAASIYSGRESHCAGMLDVRLLYSALVDADYIETAAHFEGASTTPPLPLNAANALTILTRHIQSLRFGSGSAADINGIRESLLQTCLSAGIQPPGLYTLTAPTGAGKTLAMLAFALSHALHHGLRRIVVVLPYLTIIEQTARVYEGVFGACAGFRPYERYVVEDHSLAGTHTMALHDSFENDLDDEGERSRMAEARTWDAPIVITTSVQMLESLFANRAGTCRKLHYLPRSVILFDEVQTLPLALAIPSLATLSHLSKAYGSTVVFSTATQPAFAHLDVHVRTMGGPGWRPTELVPNHDRLFEAVRRRVRVEWPRGDKLSWTDVAEYMASRHAVLCVVNMKRHAAELFATLAATQEEGAFHLSTNMCPLHRHDVLSEVQTRLREGRPCRLVATQCVEAGVDLDFPVVLRALGPLDAITQAAGRCNRNGSQDCGTVRVFVPENEDYPGGEYQRATSITRALLQRSGPEGPDLNDPSTFKQYYRMLYDLSQPEKTKEQLRDALRRHDFPEVARLYRVIPRDAVNVVVPYDPSAFERLVSAAESAPVDSRWLTSARRHAVSVYRPQPGDPLFSFVSAVTLSGKTSSDQWFLWKGPDGYDRRLGLIVPSASQCLIA